MIFLEKLSARAADNKNCPTASIAFLGDSVTQGCFEIFSNSSNEIIDVFDQGSSYETYFSKIFAALYPNTPLTVINAGISGNTAVDGLKRLHRDIISKKPDLAIVCFALNDSTQGLEGINTYSQALNSIFSELKNNGIEIIFMTPNMMTTKTSEQLPNGIIKEAAEKCCHTQNSGILDSYIETAKNICQLQNIPVCDCYALWKQMYQHGIDINTLLANKINHPNREMNWLFAIELTRTIFSL